MKGTCYIKCYMLNNMLHVTLNATCYIKYYMLKKCYMLHKMLHVTSNATCYIKYYIIEVSITQNDKLFLQVYYTYVTCLT